MAKKVLTGKVVSDKMQQTVVVEVVRKVRHPLYNKIVKKAKKFKADTNGINPVFGDMVRIEETRPMSKDKYFKVIAKITEKEAAQPVKAVDTKEASVAVEKPKTGKGGAKTREVTRKKTQKSA